MADSLRDQLLKSGIVTQAQADRASAPKRAAVPKQGNQGKKPVRKGGKPPRPSGGRTEQDIDLAKAYAVRAQSEARERRELEKAAAEQTRLRRERKAKIKQLLEGHTLNKADADQPRNFEYGGKIRRVHVDAAQWSALNAGELGVVQQAGRYLLVTRELAEQVRAIDPQQLALLIDPASAGVGEDGVPDDLMW